jgi:hypothetical protein
MGKYNNTVAAVCMNAMRNGSSSRKSYNAEYKDGRLQLFHYGTLIYSATREGEQEIGGWSRSDVDAIETAASIMGRAMQVTTSATTAKRIGATQHGSLYMK